MDDEFVSYRSPRTIVAETVYHFFRGGMYGFAYGLVTPFHAPGSPGALKEAATGIFKPAPPFGSLASVPSSTLFFGSIFAVQRFGCTSMEYLRGRRDPKNDFFGLAVAGTYYHYLYANHFLWHNRVVGGAVVLAIAYANLI